MSGDSVQAIHRPRHGDVRLINHLGETLDVRVEDLDALAARIAEAQGIPTLAATLAERR